MVSELMGLLHMPGGLLMVPESWPIKGWSQALYKLWLIEGGFNFDQFVHLIGPVAAALLIRWRWTKSQKPA